MKQRFSPKVIDQLYAELQSLDHSFVDVEGKQLKPSQCYRFETDPAHLMFNTNCPESLKEKIEEILARYIHESRS